MISSLTSATFSDTILSAMDLFHLLFHNRYSITALAGGGGKTSVMRFCAGEAGKRNISLLSTTTTKLLRTVREPGVIPGTLHMGSSLPEAPEWPLLWVGGETPDRRKWISAPSKALEEILSSVRRHTGNAGRGRLQVDETQESLSLKAIPQAVLIEADGSAGRPVKAPGPGEPVIPRQVDTLAAVLGLSALGRRVSTETVHRLEYFLSLTEVPVGKIITPELLCSLVVHPEGSFKGVLPGMRRILILNQVDSDGDLHQAEKIIALVKNMKEHRSGSAETFPEIIAVTSFKRGRRNSNPIRSIVNI